MTERKIKLLKLIIENYIKSAEPVGSKFLVENSDLNISAPTVRNEMHELEIEGFLTHPHTSAGRIPTEKGYKFYIEQIGEPCEITKFKNDFAKCYDESDDNKIKLKKIARSISDFVNNAVLIAFNKDSIYYTGISNLFLQTEFKNQFVSVDFASMFDKCEEVLYDLMNKIEGKGVSKVLIGSENPFGSGCGSVARKLDSGELIITVGPIRMDYAKHLSVLDFVSNKIKL